MQEHSEKTRLNQNPGGEEVMAQTGGKNSGLPFFAFLDADGKTLVNSRRPMNFRNIGYPNEPVEIDWFMTMLRKAAPAMTGNEARTIEERLRRDSTR